MLFKVALLSCLVTIAAGAAMMTPNNASTTGMAGQVASTGSSNGTSETGISGSTSSPNFSDDQLKELLSKILNNASDDLRNFIGEYLQGIQDGLVEEIVVEDDLSQELEDFLEGDNDQEEPAMDEAFNEGDKSDRGSSDGDKPTEDSSEGDKPDGGSSDGDKPNEDSSEGDKPKDGSSDGDKPKEDSTEGDKPKDGSSDGDTPNEGSSDGDKPKEDSTEGDNPDGMEKQSDGGSSEGMNGTDNQSQVDPL